MRIGGGGEPGRDGGREFVRGVVGGRFGEGFAGYGGLVVELGFGEGGPGLGGVDGSGGEFGFERLF